MVLSPPPNQKGTQDAHKHVQLLFYLAHDQANEYDDSIDGLLESLLGGRLGGWWHIASSWIYC